LNQLGFSGFVETFWQVPFYEHNHVALKDNFFEWGIGTGAAPGSAALSPWIKLSPVSFFNVECRYYYYIIWRYIYFDSVYESFDGKSILEKIVDSDSVGFETGHGIFIKPLLQLAFPFTDRTDMIFMNKGTFSWFLFDVVHLNTATWLLYEKELAYRNDAMIVIRTLRGKSGSTEFIAGIYDGHVWNSHTHETTHRIGIAGSIRELPIFFKHSILVIDILLYRWLHHAHQDYFLFGSNWGFRFEMRLHGTLW